MEEFRKELEQLINKHSLENGNNTPDFILAEYLTTCLKAYNQALLSRGHWYDQTPLPEQTLEEVAEQLIRLTELTNYHNMCARATLYPGKEISEIPKHKPEEMVDNLSDRTPEEKKEVLRIIGEKMGYPVPENKPEFKVEENSILTLNNSDNTLELKKIAPLSRNTIFFTVNDNINEPILKLCENGDIFVKGKLIENDKQVTDAMREFLRGHGFVIDYYPDEKKGYPSRRNADLP